MMSVLKCANDLQGESKERVDQRALACRRGANGWLNARCWRREAPAACAELVALNLQHRLRLLARVA